MKQLLFLLLAVPLFSKGVGFPVSLSEKTPVTSAGFRKGTDLDRPAFYKAMREDDKNLVNAEINQLNAKPDAATQAFLGTLYMKKAGLGGSPMTKLHLFKVGHKMLEAAIQTEPGNAEYRFLRIMIQEHAPGILGYKEDVQKDNAYINKSYKSLPGEVQQAITDYSKKSKLLKLEVS